MSVRFDLLAPSGWPTTFQYDNEAALRDTLAGIAWLAGWNYRTEYPVSTGGRCDLVVWCEEAVIAIEAKLELRTPRQYRLALQQADGYRRHFGPGDERTHLTYLAGGLIDWSHIPPFRRQYPDIDIVGIDDVFVQLCDQAGEFVPHSPGRILRSKERRRANERVTRQFAGVQRHQAQRLREAGLYEMHKSLPATAQFLSDALGLYLFDDVA